ncbi:MAG TPA: cobalamin biosynthesis protein CobD [Spirochaeta sp.]|nr:cobalamin biosynthesis protein CobD [Spirochaeta sp.]
MPLFFDTLFIWPVFIAAVLFDILVGEFPAALHPVVWMGGVIHKGLTLADQQISRIGRFFGGAAVVFSGLIIFSLPAVLITLVYSTATGPVAKIIFGILTAFMLKSTFSLAGLLKAAAAVHEALAAGDLKEARRRTSLHLVSRDTSELTENEISAAVIESVTENLTDSVVAPWIFMILGGPAAAVSYRFVNTCDSMMGYRTEKYEWLGKFAARLDDVLNYIPARISAMLIIFSASVSLGYSGRTAFKTMIREHRVTESPNAGWTMSAAAGAVGVKLVKNGHYTISGGKDLPDSEDIGRTIKLIKTSMAASAAVVIIIILLASGFFI